MIEFHTVTVEIVKSYIPKTFLKKTSSSEAWGCVKNSFDPKYLINITHLIKQRSITRGSKHHMSETKTKIIPTYFSIQDAVYNICYRVFRRLHNHIEYTHVYCCDMSSHRIYNRKYKLLTNDDFLKTKCDKFLLLMLK